MIGRVIGLLVIAGIFGIGGDYTGMYTMLFFAAASLILGLFGVLK